MAADLHQLIFAASFTLLLLAASASSSAPPPAVQGAGEGWVWTVPSPRNGSGQTPNRWAARHLFHVGDVLDFKSWKGPVLVVRLRDYERCGAASPAFRFAGGGNATTTTFLLGLSGRRGLFYFIAATPRRCEAGQRMAVRVAARYPSAISSAPAPAPVDDGPDDAPDQSVPSDRPWKKVAYAVLGFLAGGVFTFCVVFVFIRCCGNH